MSYDAWKLRSDLDEYPDHDIQCPYCGATDGLRVMSGGMPGWCGPDIICEDCFTGTDTGPGFDDLPRAKEPR